jgi:hypothetical protein
MPAGAGTGPGGGGGSAGSAGSSGAAGNATCTGAEPPASMKETIDLTWKEMTGGFAGKAGARNVNGAIQEYPNWALDNVMRSKGSINFCVRWDSDEPVSATLRDQVEDALERGVNAWFSALSGYDCFPYQSIAVKISGWAAASRATFQWEDDAHVPLFINQVSGGAPTCPQACNGYAHSDPGYQFPNCAGGFANRFDQELWLTEAYDSPNGWAWGQHVDREDFVARVTGPLYHIWLHEFGHGIGFPDYYDWNVWAPGVSAPTCVMNAGTASTVTEWDKWMFKRTWSELRKSGRWD